MAWQAAASPTQYPVDYLPAGLSDEINTVQRRVKVLSERVDDAQVRDGVRAVLHAGVGAIPPPSAGADARSADAAMMRMAVAMESLNERIGTILRSLPID